MHAEDLARRFRDAARALTSAAVTGTNGKTTTVSMIAAIVTASGEASARLTTVGAWVDGEHVLAASPPEEFLATVESAVRSGVRCLALEVTSKALAGGLARRWPVQCAVFTNLTRDHLDMHGSPESYLAAKSQLFMHLPPGGVAILNADDPSSALIDEVTPPSARRLYYGTRGGGWSCDLRSERILVARGGTRIELAESDLGSRLGGVLELGVIGEVHGQNAMAAALACHALGYSPEAITAGLRHFVGVKGRFEVVGPRPLVVVDYAHTPDGLQTTLATARQLVEAGGALVCVFGCGGERDRGKRPMMGEVADRLADRVIVTSDNPRREQPEAIAEDIEAGARGQARWHRELDRKLAIELAVTEAGPADVVVIAGKGHETVQEIAGQMIEMSDQDIAGSVLRSLSG